MGHAAVVIHACFAQRKELKDTATVCPYPQHRRTGPTGQLRAVHRRELFS